MSPQYVAGDITPVVLLIVIAVAFFFAMKWSGSAWHSNPVVVVGLLMWLTVTVIVGLLFFGLSFFFDAIEFSWVGSGIVGGVVTVVLLAVWWLREAL